MTKNYQSERPGERDAETTALPDLYRSYAGDLDMQAGGHPHIRGARICSTGRQLSGRAFAGTHYRYDFRAYGKAQFYTVLSEKFLSADSAGKNSSS